MLPLATSTWDDEEHKALQNVIESGMFTMGPKVAEFEKKFADYVGTKYAVMVNSGSSANLLAVASLFFRQNTPLSPGDEVIVPAVSWSTTFFPLQQYGLKVKFVDIDKATLNIDLKKVEESITDKTKAIFAVNLLGNSVDYLQLSALVEQHNLILLEDNCESLGATLEDKRTGAFGLLSTFSTFFSHHISTMEGGVVCTDEEELYHILLSLRSHGWTRHLPEENQVCKKSDDPFSESFRFVLPGYNLRPLEMSGALGIVQLEKLPKIVTGRRENAEVFKELFAEMPDIRIQQETGKSSWFGFAVIMENNSKCREQLTKKLHESGVDCRPIVAGNFLLNPAVDYFDYEVYGEMKNANAIHQNGFFIGNHHFDISGELEKVANIVAKHMRSH